MNEQQKEDLDLLKEYIANPLCALKVYAPFCRFRDYFTLHIHPNIRHDIKQTLGRMMLESVFECEQLLPRCQFGSRRGKLTATMEFLHHFAFILSGVEFRATHAELGVSIRQATEMVMLIKEIQSQMGKFRNYLRHTTEEDDCQDPQPTGEGSEQVLTKGSCALM